MDNAPMHTPSFSDKVAANAAFDIAFRGDAESIDADMAQLFANEKAELLEALKATTHELDAMIPLIYHETTRNEMQAVADNARRALAEASQ